MLDPSPTPPGPTPGPVSPPTSPRVSLRRLMTCLVLTTALGALDQTVVATALPTIVADLDAVDRSAWVLTAYLLAMSVAMPVVGSLGDRFGSVRLLRLSIAVFVLASVVCAAAQDVEQLALARALQGLGGAGMLVLPQALVAEVVPARDRAAVLGPLGAVFAVATVVGPLVGGSLTDAGSWRLVFWINLPLGGLALLLACTALRSGPGRHVAPAGFDVLGTLLLVLATSALAWTASVLPHALSGAGSTARTSSIATVVVTVVLVTGFVVHQLRTRSPLLPVGVLRERGVWLAAVLAGTVGFGMFGIIAYVPSWVQGVHGTSATTSGLLLLPVTAGLVSGVNISGRLVRRTGRWKPFPVLGCTLAALAAATLAVVGPDLGLAATAAVLVLFGLGAGSFMALVVVLAQDGAPSNRVAGVTGTIAYVRETGATVGTAVLGGLLAVGLAATSGPGPDASHHGEVFTPLFSCVAVVFAIGVAAALALPARELRTTSVVGPAA